MTNSPVTIATFNTPNEAAVAQHVLSVEGIESTLADEATVGIAWHLGNAVGGVKLQVDEQEAERAIQILESREPVEIREEDWRTSVEPEEGYESDEDNDEDSKEAVDDVAAPIGNERTANLRRALIAAVMGLMFCPLHFYSLTLLANVATSSGPLRSGDKWRFVLALGLSLAIPIILAVFAFTEGLRVKTY